MKIEGTEEERQMLLLALACLSCARPGWDDALNRLALKMERPTSGPDGPSGDLPGNLPGDIPARATLYDQFRATMRTTAWHRFQDQLDLLDNE